MPFIAFVFNVHLSFDRLISVKKQIANVNISFDWKKKCATCTFWPLIYLHFAKEIRTIRTALRKFNDTENRFSSLLKNLFCKAKFQNLTKCEELHKYYGFAKRTCQFLCFVPWDIFQTHFIIFVGISINNVIITICTWPAPGTRLLVGLIHFILSFFKICILMNGTIYWNHVILIKYSSRHFNHEL